MRWAWNYDEYVERERLGRMARTMLPPFVTWLRAWDYATAARVDQFIANSPAVAARIAKFYRRDSVVIPPPVDTSQFHLSDERDDAFLVVSRLIPYKRIDLAVRACTQVGLRLDIIGGGRDEGRLRKLAGKTVRFLGRLPDAEVRDRLARCRALIFPGEEDFGLTPVEANASGRPVIAYRAGGALTTVVEGQTGVFFDEQTPETLAQVLASFQEAAFDPRAIRRHAEGFDTAVFQSRIARLVEDRIAAHPVLAEKARRAGMSPHAATAADAFARVSPSGDAPGR